MKKKNELGFSLIELLIVVVIIGIIVAVAVPSLQKGIRASENSNMYASLRSIATAQTTFFSQRSRYARLNEVNNIMSGTAGTPSGNDLLRGKFVLSMVPSSPQPTDAELKDTYTVTATRNVLGEGVTYVYSINQSGITTIFP